MKLAWRILTVVIAALGIISAAVSVWSALSSALRVDPSQLPELVSYYTSLASFLEPLLLLPINFIVGLLGFGPFSLPAGYVEALIPSAILTVGYIRVIRDMDRRGEIPENPYRKYLIVPYGVVFSFSLLGLSLLVSILQNSIRDKRDSIIAFQTLMQIGALLVASLLFVLLNLSEAGSFGQQ